MKNIYHTLSTIFIGLFLSNCTSPKSIVVNLQMPPEIALPNTINSVIIVDNFIPQPADYGNTNIKYDNKGKLILEELSVNTDSLAPIFTESTYKKLAGENYFSNVSIYNKAIREDLAYQDIKPIDSISAREICDISNSDAIISLDKLDIRTSQSEGFVDFDLAKEKLISSVISANFSIYLQNGKLISTPTISFCDTIYWSGLYQQDRLISDFDIPSREDALNESARYAGSKIARSLVPYWKSEPRLYYTESNQALKLAEQEQWGEARKTWEADYKKETKNKKKARLATNIALAYELTDNLKEAIRWSNIAADLFNKSIQTSVDSQNAQRANNYKQRLIERFVEFKVLDTYSPLQ